MLTIENDPALDAAVERVRELSLRLWAVRAAHRPSRGRWRGLRCGTCGQPHPCGTLRAAGDSEVVASRAGR